jgi:hypothetical protein
VIKNLLLASLMILLLLPPLTTAGAVNEEILDAINKTCIPAAEMALAGVRLGDSRVLVESRLGTPNPPTDQDPAGVLAFQGLSIRLHATRVQSVLATSSKWSTPAGIRPGLSQSEVGAILGFDLDSIEPPHSKSPTGYHIHRCIEPGEQIDVEQYIRLEPSTDRTIRAVEIFWVAP